MPEIDRALIWQKIAIFLAKGFSMALPLLTPFLFLFLFLIFFGNVSERNSFPSLFSFLVFGGVVCWKRHSQIGILLSTIFGGYSVEKSAANFSRIYHHIITFKITMIRVKHFLWYHNIYATKYVGKMFLCWHALKLNPFSGMSDLVKLMNA